MCSVAVPLLFVLAGIGLVVGYWMVWPAIRDGFRGVTSADIWRTGLSRAKHLTAFCLVWLALAIDALLLHTHHC